MGGCMSTTATPHAENEWPHPTQGGPSYGTFTASGSAHAHTERSTPAVARSPYEPPPRPAAANQQPGDSTVWTPVAVDASVAAPLGARVAVGPIDPFVVAISMASRPHAHTHTHTDHAAVAGAPAAPAAAATYVSSELDDRRLRDLSQYRASSAAASSHAPVSARSGSGGGTHSRSNSTSGARRTNNTPNNHTRGLRNRISEHTHDPNLTPARLDPADLHFSHDNPSVFGNSHGSTSLAERQAKRRQQRRRRRQREAISRVTLADDPLNPDMPAGWYRTGSGSSGTAPPAGDHNSPPLSRRPPRRSGQVDDNDDDDDSESDENSHDSDTDSGNPLPNPNASSQRVSHRSGRRAAENDEDLDDAEDNDGVEDVLAAALRRRELRTQQQIWDAAVRASGRVPSPHPPPSTEAAPSDQHQHATNSRHLSALRELETATPSRAPQHDHVPLHPHPPLQPHSHELSNGNTPSAGDTGSTSSDHGYGHASAQQKGDHEGKTAAPPDCVVCLTERATYACVPCGHLCLCSDCSSDQWRYSACPLCRTPLADRRPFLHVFT